MTHNCTAEEKTLALRATSTCQHWCHITNRAAVRHGDVAAARLRELRRLATGSEKARRAAKKAARATQPAEQQIRLGQQLPSSPAAAVHLAPTSSLGVGDQYDNLPGLREDVIATPRGRREHRFKHTSPGGSAYFDEYASPAGVQQQACNQRQECLHRLTAARRAAASERAASERAAATAADAAAAAKAPRSRLALTACLTEDRMRKRHATHARCDSCEACQAWHCTRNWRKRPSAWAYPCKMKLIRLGYRNLEIHTVYELTAELCGHLSEKH